MSARTRRPSVWSLIFHLVWFALGLLTAAGPACAESSDRAALTATPIPAPARPLPNATEILGLPSIPNARCLHCHADSNKKTAVREDGTEIDIYVDPERLEQSVHGDQPCVGCHNGIRRAAHEVPLPKSIGCVQCHVKPPSGAWRSSAPADSC